MSFASRQLAAAAGFYDIAVAQSGSPYVTVYKWDNGFTTKYSDPSPAIPANALSVAFSGDRQYIATGHSSSPYVSVYNWDNGFGSKFADPGTTPGQTVNSVAFASNSAYIATAHDITSSVQITVYGWSGSGFGTRYTNTSLGGDGQAVAFGSGNAAIFLGGDSSPRVAAWAWSGSGFGTRYSNPSTLPPASVNGIAVSPASDYVAVAHFTSPFFSVYPWNLSTGFGTRLTPPAVDPVPLTGNGIDFHPTQSVIAIAHNASPYITIYSFTPSTWSKFSNPGTLPTGEATGVKFSPDGENVAVTHLFSPHISVYPWSVSGFGTKYANPGTSLTGTARGVSWGG